MKKLLLYILVLVSSYSSLVAQQVNTLYFMDNVPYRNKLNPAFQPLNNFYFGLTPIGYTGFGIGNNSLTVKDIIYKDPLDPDGPPITFLHPHGNFNNFLKAIRPNTLIGTNLDLNFLAMGFRTGNSYWNLSVAGKTSFQLMASKYISDGHWGLDFSSYLEAGLGYSRNWNDRLSIGLKAKYLWGIMQGQVNNDVKLDTSDGLKISGTTNLKLASPLELNPTDLSSIITGGQDIMTELTKPTGTGLGLDLGATWKIIPNLTLSAAVVDLGMINWTKNTRSYTATIQFDSNDVTSQLFSPNSDSIMSGILENAIGVDSTIGGSYRTYTDPKLNVGLEFGLVKDKITLGLLSRTMMHRGRMFEEVTTSLNLKPLSWFDLSTSYSLMNGRWSNVGAGLGLRLGFLHMFLGADYVPMRFVRYNTFNYVPSNTKGVNLALGFNIVFGSNKDSDKDGVPDRKDKYPGTPRHVAVDKKGRALDTDNDGVPDYQDKCPGTPPEAGGYVDSNGCPLDTDGDSIPNYKDICPDTPEAAYGRVDTTGCPADTDGDGAPDYVDKCPQTPKNAIADKNGCPLDTDSDGVADYLDKCPGTPVQARGAVDSTGCLLDSDSDSIPDYLDKCPGTPVEALGKVDSTGCPLDNDSDSIPDYLDKCPGTPVEARGAVDAGGCPLDTDGDGTPDYLDKCPKIAGVDSNHGCPEIKNEVKALFKKALNGIQFEPDKLVIKPVSFKILDDIAAILIANPLYLIEIQGHTDNTGKPEANLVLSEDRAKAVKDYLEKKGIAPGRMSSKGFGDTRPVAPNNTKAGKALNRRVEFVVSFEDTVKQQ